MKKILIGALLCASTTTFAQTSTDYSDVAVIVNDNSSASVSVSNYFQQARNIPAQNMIHINVPATEIIDSLQFEDLRTQIENYLVTNNLVDSINYLVTTKGVPLRVERTGCVPAPGVNILNCTSVESELTLILSANAGEIGSPGFYLNPYFNVGGNFSRAQFDMYLVTRVDGYTVQEVYDLIDRSGPNTPVNPISNQFVFDLVGLNSSDSSFYSGLLNPAMQNLQTSGWNLTYDPAYDQIAFADNVLGYVRAEQTNNPNVIFFDFVPGSISEHVNSTQQLTFDSSAIIQNNTLPVFIGYGAVGGRDFVYPTYYSLIQNVNNTFSYYTSEQYNLAESFYYGLHALSWADLIVGDPKTSLHFDNTAGISEPTADVIQIGPNPSDGHFTVYPNGTQIESLYVYGPAGQLVYQYRESISSPTSIELPQLAGGMYILHMQSEGQTVQKRLVVQK